MYASPYYWWVQSVMPVVFDNSLSYYEVLAKLTSYMEGIIKDVDQIEKILATIEGIEDVTQFVEFLESIQAQIGTLANLSTTNKSDLVSAINEVALKANNAYIKPVTGIPETDLSQDVRDKLNSGGESGSYIINNKLLMSAPSNNSPDYLGLGTYSVPEGGIPESTLSQEVRNKLNSGGSGGTSDYSALINKPQINGHTLYAGNNSSQTLELGTGNYTDLINKPQINGHTLDAGNNSSQTLGLGTYSKPVGGIPESDLADAVVNKLNTSGGIADENVGTIAQRDYEIGELVYINGVLYKVTMRTLTGSNFVIGTNIVATDINDELLEINSKIDAMASGEGLDSWTLSAILKGAGSSVEQAFFQYIRCTGGEDYLFIINRSKYSAPFVLKIYARDGTLIDTQTADSTSYNDYRFTFTPEDTGDYYCAILMTASGSDNVYITVTLEYTQSQGISELWNQINAAQSVVDDVAALQPLVEQNTEDISYLSSTLEQAIEDFAVPTQEAVDNWLTEHPEATTTVQDHSLTIDKMVIGTLGYVTPEMFNAVGDGETNDWAAFNAMFSFANANKIMVCLTPDKEYVVNGEPITIKTSFCGNGSAILTDNNSPSIDLDRRIFIVASDSIFNSTKTENCFIVRTYPNHANIWKRLRDGVLNDGVVPYEANANVNNNLAYSWFFDFADPVEQYRNIDDPITIDDLQIQITCETGAGDYYQNRGIQVERDNVTFNRLKFNLVNETANATRVLGLVRLYKCYNTIFNNCIIPAMLSNSAYAVHGTQCLKTSFINCVMTGVNACWGATAFNGAVDLSFEGCIINRIDAHEGMYGLNVNNCTVGYYGIQITGGWYANITNSAFVGSRNLVGFREDYGNGFNGVINIKNVKVIRPYFPYLFRLLSSGNYDFGFEWKHPTISIENVDVYLPTNTTLDIFRYEITDSQLSWFSIRNSISCKNITCNRNIRLFYNFPVIFGSTNIFIENTYLMGGFYYSFVGDSSLSARINAYITNCFAYVPTLNGSTVNILFYFDRCQLNNLGFEPRMCLMNCCVLSSSNNVFEYSNGGKRFNMCNMFGLVKSSEIDKWHDNSFNFKAEE